jgi:hypothetical protein
MLLVATENPAAAAGKRQANSGERRSQEIGARRGTRQKTEGRLTAHYKNADITVRGVLKEQVSTL